MKADSLVHMGAFVGLGKVLVLDPLETVARDFPLGGFHGGHLLGCPCECGGHAIYGDGQVLEHPVEAPEACPRAVFVDRLHVPVALTRPCGGADDLGQERLGRGIAVKQVVLTPLFIVQHDLNSDLCTPGPGRVRRRGSVAGHVTGVAGRLAHLVLSSDHCSL